MPSKTRFQSIRLRNLLSFGPDSEAFELGPLNVLIGPNGSGKSNFLEAFGLLKDLPGDLAEDFSNGGGLANWLWKGGERKPVAELEVVLTVPRVSEHLDYRIAFSEREHRLNIHKETLAIGDPNSGGLFLSLEKGNVAIAQEGRPDVRFELEAHNIGLSLLFQPEVWAHTGVILRMIHAFKSLHLYRDWNFGRDAAPRRAQPVDLRNDFLMENCRNLGGVLNQFQRKPKIKRAFLDYLKRFYQDVEGLELIVQGGTIQIYLQERSLTEDLIPSSRLSDGTLRWLALLAILLHPDPPPLVCLEEPEIGLHPHMIHVLAELLREASERMQLVVTTHSDILVDALTSTPEAVIVCEKEEGRTKLKRLGSKELAVWLKEYSLGDLWLRGQIGGGRW